MYKTYLSNTPKLKPLLVLKQKHKTTMLCNATNLHAYESSSNDKNKSIQLALEKSSKQDNTSYQNKSLTSQSIIKS